MIQLNDNQRIALSLKRDELIGFAQRITGKECTVDIKFLEDIEVSRITLSEFIAKIKQICATEYGIEVVCLGAKTRKREIVECRQIAMFLLNRHTELSLKSIGIEFGGRDHSTVIHARQTVNDLIDTDRQFKRKVEKLNWHVTTMNVGAHKLIKINKTPL